jgi:hypothetical protein
MGERLMKKPLIFAIRGAVGFSLAPAVILGTLAWALVDRLPGNEPPRLLAIGIPFAAFLFAGGLGAAILSFGTIHWKRAVVGFGLISIPAVFLVIAVAVPECSSSINVCFQFCTLVLGWSLGFALFGGIGGLCLRRSLALPGVVYFGLPGACFSILAWKSSDMAALFLITAPLAIGGAFLGSALGRLERDSAPMPPPPD